MEKHKFLYILIGVLSMLILVLIGYIVYDNTNTDINENDNKEYKVLTEDSKMYLVEKKDNSYKVVYNFKEIINYIGIYKNKLYYSDTKIKYIDLNSNTLTEKVWLEIPQIECEENCTANEIDKSVIVGDTLYFNIGSFAAGTDKLDGLLSLSMNASEFSEYKIISPLAEEWFMDEFGENIYYMNFYREDNAVYKYNISSNNKQKLFNIASYLDHISYVSNNVIYYNFTKDELSLFNLNSSEMVALANNLKDVTTSNNSMWGISSTVGKNLYYYDGNGNIVKYDIENGNKTNYYKIEDTFYYRGYNFYDDNNFEITYDCHKNDNQEHNCTKTNEYISNNKIVNQFPEINVIMLDGSSKMFTIKNFEIN